MVCKLCWRRGDVVSDAENPCLWTRRFSIGLTCSVAGFAAWGALAPHIPAMREAAPLATGALMASFYGNAQGLANCSAANFRRAWACGDGFRAPALFFFACFVGLACVSTAGLHSAWAFAQANAGSAPLPDDRLMRPLFWFVAFCEPALNYGVEALKALHRSEQKAEDREALDDAANREIRRREAGSRHGSHPFAAPAAAVAIATATPTNAVAFAERQATEIPAERHAPQDVVREAHVAHGWCGPRDPKQWQRVAEAFDLGMAPAEIIRTTGVAPTTGYRWLALLRRGVRRAESA